MTATALAAACQGAHHAGFPWVAFIACGVPLALLGIICVIGAMFFSGIQVVG